MAPATKKVKQCSEEEPKPESFAKNEEEVAEKLLSIVGTPPDFVGIKANKVNRSWYRVNIRCLKPGVQGLIKLTRIQHSYFVQYKNEEFVDGDKVEKIY